MREYVKARLEEGYHLIPEYMQGGVERYMLDGIMPGSFLRAVLNNDFMGAASNADYNNQQILFKWAMFLYNHAPAGSFGSPENVRNWRGVHENAET